MVELAREQRITHLMLGREVRRGIGSRFTPDIAEQVLRQMPEVEVHLVGTGPDPAGGEGAQRAT